MISGPSLAFVPKDGEIMDGGLSIEETALLIETGLIALEAGDITNIFFLSNPVSLPDSGRGNMDRVAFLDSAKKCFIYDIRTSETVFCDSEERIFLREVETMTAHEISNPYSNYSLTSGMQVAGLGDWLCSHRKEITAAADLILIGTGTGGAVGAVTKLLGRMTLKSGAAIGGTMATGGLFAAVAAGELNEEIEKAESGTSAKITALAIVIPMAAVAAGTTAVGVVTGTAGAPVIIAAIITGAGLIAIGGMEFCPSIG